MKKILSIVLPIVIVLVIALYIIFGNQTTATPVVTAPESPTSTGTGVTTTTASTSAASGYKDGSYTSPVSDAVYGKLQVAVVISSGKITQITTPLYPNEGGHTTEISNNALPILEQEAIASQSANVNIVSGATQTSQAFEEALASALSQAKS